MSKYKEAILQQFDQLIAEFQTLLDQLPYQPQEYFIRDIAFEETTEEQRDKYFDLRSQCLEFLSSIPSNDQRLLNAIEGVRGSIHALQFNVERILDTLRGLRGDFSAGLLDAAKTSSEPATRANYLLHEALHEVKHFQRPFTHSDIDRLEQKIKYGVRLGFGENSRQLQEVHTIFHPRRKAALIKKYPTDLTKLYVTDFSNNREKLDNLLEILLDEIRLQSSVNRADIQNKSHNFTNYFWFIFSVSIWGMIFIILRTTYFYSHPNKLAIDAFLSSLIPYVILRIKLPEGIGLSSVSQIVILIFDLLTGME